MPVDLLPIPEMSPGELRGALEDIGLSNAEAAEWLDVGLSTVSHWATGERAIPAPVAILIRSMRAEPCRMAAIRGAAVERGLEAPPRQRGRPRRQAETPDSKKAAG